jgi:hypothetical protein
VAGCRFVLSPTARDSILVAGSLVEVRNCEFYGGDQSYHVDWDCPPGGKLFLHNNLIGGGEVGLAVHYRHPNLKDVLLQVTSNTLVADMPIAFHFDRIPEPAKGSLPQDRKPVHVAASDNLIDGRHAMVSFVQDLWFIPPAKRLPAHKVTAILPQVVSWSGQRNLYAAERDFVNLSFGVPGQRQPVAGLRSLADWNRMWGKAEVDSMQGRIHYRRVPAPSALAPEKAIAEDFRLRRDSAGKGAHPGGKDLGAAVDLVGPGPAYERWKQTAEYQQWLKDTGQAQRPAAAQPFVILPRSGKAEQPYDSLAEAVEGARAGDTIEVRGDGPFRIGKAGVHIRRALTIRAASGYQPVLQMVSTEAGEERSKCLLEAWAPLTLEGLTLDRTGSHEARSMNMGALIAYG